MLRHTNPYATFVTCLRKVFGILSVVSALGLSGAEARMRLDLVIEDYPPLMGQTLPYGGLLTRIVTEAYAQAGVSVHLTWVPNNRAIFGTMAGQYDGSYGWAHAPERDAKLLYPVTVLYPFRMVFFHRRGESYPWKKLEDLRPFRIGVTMGNHYSDEFSALQAAGTLNVDPASSDTSGMKKLASGRIDLFPMEQEAGQMLADLVLSKADREKITFQKDAIWEVPTYVVIRRTHPQAQEIVDRFDRGYRKLVSTGRLKVIIAETRKAIRDKAKTP